VSSHEQSPRPYSDPHGPFPARCLACRHVRAQRLLNHSLNRTHNRASRPSLDPPWGREQHLNGQPQPAASAAVLVHQHLRHHPDLPEIYSHAAVPGILALSCADERVQAHPRLWRHGSHHEYLLLMSLLACLPRRRRARAPSRPRAACTARGGRSAPAAVIAACELVNLCHSLFKQFIMSALPEMQ